MNLPAFNRLSALRPHVSPVILAALSSGVLGFSAAGQVVIYEAASVAPSSTLNWDDPTSWTVTRQDNGASVPGVYPNNDASSSFTVTTPGTPAFNLSTDITITSLDDTDGFDIILGGRSLTINGVFDSLASEPSAATVVVHGGTLRLNGDSQMESHFSLQDGAILENNGTLSTQTSSVVADFADTHSATGGATVINNNVIIGNRPSGTVDGLGINNNGEWHINGVELQAETYTQLADVNLRGDKIKTTLQAGGSLTAKDLKIDGGQVLVLGNATITGISSYKFNGGGVIIGQNPTGPCHLTLNGIPAANAGNGGSFEFLVNGSEPGQYSTLFVQNGGNGSLFDGLTLSLSGGYTLKDGDRLNLITGANLGACNFKNIQPGNKIEIAGYGLLDLYCDNTHVTLGLGSVVPEPEEVAVVSAIGLLGFGLWRGRRNRSLRTDPLS